MKTSCHNNARSSSLISQRPVIGDLPCSKCEKCSKITELRWELTVATLKDRCQVEEQSALIRTMDLPAVLPQYTVLTADSLTRVSSILPPGQDAMLYSIGFVIATGCLHAVGIGIGHEDRS